MEKQAEYLTESETENQYRPWVELGLDELQYYKRLYLRVTTENAELERDLDEARRLFDAVADVAFALIRENYFIMRRFGNIHHEGHEEDETHL